MDSLLAHLGVQRANQDIETEIGILKSILRKCFLKDGKLTLMAL